MRGFSEGKSEARKRATIIDCAKNSNILFAASCEALFGDKIS